MILPLKLALSNTANTVSNIFWKLSKVTVTEAVLCLSQASDSTRRKSLMHTRTKYESTKAARYNGIKK